MAVLATEHPDRLGLVRRGWAVELIAAAVAAAAIAVRRRPTPQAVSRGAG